MNTQNWLGCVVGLGVCFGTATTWAAGDVSEIVGRWSLTVDAPEGKLPSWLSIEQKNGRLSGRFCGFVGGVHDAEGFSYADGVISFKARHGAYRARLEGEQLVGELNIDEEERAKSTCKFIGVRDVYRPNVTGTWTLIEDTAKHRLVLEAEGKTIKGTLTRDGEDDAVAIRDASITDAQLHFVAEGMGSFVADICGDRMSGSIKDEDASQSFTAIREREWGNPIVLFNGKDLTGWTGVRGAAIENWKVRDGAMVNTRNGGNIRTADEFMDFKLALEFNIHPHSNSGVYLRGRYEIQIFDDYGRPPVSDGCGALYTRLTPPVNASRKAGQWQALEVTLIGRCITVVLNGTTLFDNVRLEGITGGAIDSDENAAGPIFFQGDHGRVQYRAIKLWPAKAVR